MKKKLKTLRMIVQDDMTVTFEETDELKSQVYEKVLQFFLDMGAFSGESIMQSDDPQLEAPELLSDLADYHFRFQVEYHEDE
jgi:hypothetical protein